MTVYREIVRRLGRNRTFRRRLPDRLGGARFLATTEGGLKLLRRELALADPPLTRVAEARLHRGMTVWDVGANAGLFSFMAAGLVGREGRVVAIEPDTWLATNLRRSARLNTGRDVAPVDVLCVALSDSCAVMRFHIAESYRATSFLEGVGTSEARGTREVQMVPTMTLDALFDALPAPDFVKIDVEGAEADVLAGAARLLRERAPMLLIEVAAAVSNKVGRALSSVGYAFYDADRVGLPSAHQPPPTTLAIRGAAMGGDAGIAVGVNAPTAGSSGTEGRLRTR